jgi:hypothetical protein
VAVVTGNKGGTLQMYHFLSLHLLQSPSSCRLRVWGLLLGQEMGFAKKLGLRSSRNA